LSKNYDNLYERVTHKTLHQRTKASKPEHLVNNILGSNPKKDIYAFNRQIAYSAYEKDERRKKWIRKKKIDKDSGDPDGMYRDPDGMYRE